MPTRPFLPTPNAIHVLIALGFIAGGWAMYIRYIGIESAVIALPCDAGLKSALCTARTFIIPMFLANVFGWCSLAAAVVHFVRPGTVQFGVAAVATALGVVLFNSNIAGYSVALLVLSFARPVSAEA